MIWIFSFLEDPRDICKCSQVCKFWHTVSNDNSLWKDVCFRILPEIAKQIPFPEYEAMIRSTKDKTLVNVLPSYLRDSKFKRTIKRRKVNGGPKRCMSAYMYFSQGNRAKVRTENPQMKFAAIGKELGDRWKKLPTIDKQKYQEKAAEDKKRYMNEKADYPARCKREEEAFYVQVATNPSVLFSLTQKLAPQPRNTNKRKRDQQQLEAQAQIQSQNKNYKVFFQNQTKALITLDCQVKQQQQCRFLEGLAFLFEINRKRQMMMEMMMDSDSDDDSDGSDHLYDSSSDGGVGCLYGGPFFWSSDSDGPSDDDDVY